MERKGYVQTSAILAGLLGAAFLGSASNNAVREEARLVILPKCEGALNTGETIVWIPEEQITRTIGRTAVCKIDDQVYSIVPQQK